MNTNIVSVSFGANRKTRSRALHVLDYGQKLIPVGIELPSTYEVHFAVDKTGQYYTELGDESGVLIPDALLENAGIVYAYIYLHAGDDDGETVYTVEIPVIQRANNPAITPTPEERDIISEAIAALNEAVDRTEAAADSAEENAESAAESAFNALQSESNALQSAQSALNSASNAASSAASALASERAAGASEQNAAASATSASASADRAEQSAKNAGYLWFYIEEGKLYMERTDNTQVTFYMQDGKLYVEEVA